MTLTTDHLFDVGVDACLELIRTYRDSDIPGNAAVIQMVVPAVMQQAERLGKAISEGKTTPPPPLLHWCPPCPHPPFQIPGSLPGSLLEKKKKNPTLQQTFFSFFSSFSGSHR